MILSSDVAGYLTTAVLAAVAVLLALYDLALITEILRWLHSPRFRRWLRTPPGSWTEDIRQLGELLRAAWRRTRRLLRM